MVQGQKLDRKLPTEEKHTLPVSQYSPGIVKKTNLAVVARRLDGKTKWEEIQHTIRRLTGIDAFVSPFSGNNVIIWCRDKKEREKIIKGVLFKNKKNVAILKEWEAVDQWEDNRVKYRKWMDRHRRLAFRLVEYPRPEDDRRKIRRDNSDCQRDFGTDRPKVREDQYLGADRRPSFAVVGAALRCLSDSNRDL